MPTITIDDPDIYSDHLILSLFYLFVYSFNQMNMPDKVDVTVAIEEYRLEMADCISKYKRALIFMFLLPFPGFIWFWKVIKKRRALDDRRIEIQEMLKQISSEIPFDEYMEMRKRFITTKTY